jgi:carbamate kinase
MNILIALGGNAILQENERGTFEEQQANIVNTARHITKIIKGGNNVVITHGNGPQVGDILLRYELAKVELPAMPLHVCGGESQGMIGYMMEQAITNELQKESIGKEVVCVLTRTVVGKDDPHFEKPSKPIGPFYEKREADKLAKELGWTLMREDGKYRRVVPSPLPLEIVELDTIKKLMSKGKIVICAGGGGVPVIKEKGSLGGVDAVIDKDLASSLLARKLKVDLFMILTDVDSVFLNYRKKSQRKLTRVNVGECKAYLADGQFEDGTMKPKMEAAMSFVEATGKHAVITALADADKALRGKKGTVIVQ